MNIGSESETIGFEESIDLVDNGMLSLAAMLNRSNRGTVFFGVGKNGEIVGMDIDDSVLERIRNAVKSIEPRIAADVQALESDNGKGYVSVSSKGYEIPYSCDGRFVIRHGSSDEPMPVHLLGRMVMSRGFDPMKEMESRVQDLSLTTLCDMMSSRGLHPRDDPEFYDSIGLLTKDRRFNLNAWILSDDNNILMQIVEFEGRDRTVFSRRTDFGGQCMLMGMRNILDYMRPRNETKVDFSSSQRVDTDLFDMDCFREAWFNACLHNSWRTGSVPMVAVFDDRIEIESNGPMPYGVDMDDFCEGRSSPVNESLYRLAEKMGFVRDPGNGIPAIIGKYGRDAIKATEAYVKVTIPFAFEPACVSARKYRSLAGSGLDDRERFVLEHLAKHRQARISEVAEAACLSESAVKRTIASLKAKGLLENNGTNRNSVWNVLM